MSKVRTTGDYHYGTQQLRMFAILPFSKAIQKPKLKIRSQHEKLTKGIDLHYGLQKEMTCTMGSQEKELTVSKRGDTVGHCTVGSCEHRNTLDAITA